MNFVTRGASGAPSSTPGTAAAGFGTSRRSRPVRPPGTSSTVTDAVAPPGSTENCSPPPSGATPRLNPDGSAANAASNRVFRSPTVRAPARSTVRDAVFPAPSSSVTVSSPGVTPAPPCRADSGVPSVSAGPSGRLSAGVRTCNAAYPWTAVSSGAWSPSCPGTPPRSPVYSVRPPPRSTKGDWPGSEPANRERPRKVRLPSRITLCRSAAISSASAAFSAGPACEPMPPCKIVRAVVTASANAASPVSVADN